MSNLFIQKSICILRVVSFVNVIVAIKYMWYVLKIN